MERDRRMVQCERSRLLRSRERFWRVGDLRTPTSTTQHLLAALVDDGELLHVRRGLYWRGLATPLGMSPPPTSRLIREVAPGPGVGPAAVSAANHLRLSTQVPRDTHYAVPRRAPRAVGQLRFTGRATATGRVAARLGPTEVAFLEALTAWAQVVELPAQDAVARLLELLAGGHVRPDRLACAAQTEPAATRARLAWLLVEAGRDDLAATIPGADPRTSAAALAPLGAA